ncbi:hypothetical protein CEP54_004513 [Fusarium duplospermum]|uniref:Uncharacterized protein n=1 Tax=Fusarium duplospermum TaxID=1325734 RepID=A0A428QHM5_9HYPO|nr:hypothetical protein CEP54_004513 [Fusarium duplospermum]
MADTWEFPAPNSWDPTIPVRTLNPWEAPAPNPGEEPAPAPAPAPNPWDVPAAAPSPWDGPVQTRPGGGGSWFESMEPPRSFITLTTASIPPIVTPTALAEETPPKGTTPWLYATVACIIAIIILLVFICLLWAGNRQLSREAKSRKEAERRLSAVMRDNREYQRDEEEGNRP